MFDLLVVLMLIASVFSVALIWSAAMQLNAVDREHEARDDVRFSVHRTSPRGSEVLGR